MVKLREESRIEIWSNEYINDVDRRQAKDKNMVIIQIEVSSSPKEHIVEIIPKIK